MPGIISAFTAGQPIKPIIHNAVSDALTVVILLVLIIFAAYVIETAFKKVACVAIGGKRVEELEGYLTYPGVIFHELSHALFATLSGAKVEQINFHRDTKYDDGMTLGSVTYYTRGGHFASAVQRTLASIAPAFMGLLAMGFILLFIFPHCTQWWHFAIWGYLFVCILLHSELSPPDMKGAWSGIPIVFLYLILLFAFIPFDMSWWQRIIPDALFGGGLQGIWDKIVAAFLTFQTFEWGTISAACSEIGNAIANYCSAGWNEAIRVFQSFSGVNVNGVDVNSSIDQVVSDAVGSVVSKEAAGVDINNLSILK